jgi:hypothetical protein
MVVTLTKPEVSLILEALTIAVEDASIYPIGETEAEQEKLDQQINGVVADIRAKLGVSRQVWRQADDAL